MSTLTFHIGRAKPMTKEEKRKRKAHQKKPQKRSLTSFSPRPQWRILPCKFQYSFMIDTLSGNSYFEKMRALEEYGTCYKKSTSSLFKDFKMNPAFLESIEEMKKECKKLCAENQILRWKFKRFVTQWRLRHFKQINDNDFNHLGTIQSPITVYIFPTRSKYTFEASSILQDIHKKLLDHDGQIPTPLFPRNPYTNQNFNLSQLLSIQEQCKQVGKAVWTLESFSKSNLNIDKFMLVHRKPLRIHALKSILYNFDDYEGIYLLLNFIESQHDEHQAHFNRPLYRWFVQKYPEEHKIQQWRRLCKEYYEEEILAEDDTERDNCFLRIVQKTGHLCAPPHDLVYKRNSVLQIS